MGIPPDLSDAALIRASSLDSSVVGLIFDRHALAVRAFLERRVGRGAAEDLLGEVFRVTFERRVQFRPVHDSARP